MSLEQHMREKTSLIKDLREENAKLQAINTKLMDIVAYASSQVNNLPASIKINNMIISLKEMIDG